MESKIVHFALAAGICILSLILLYLVLLLVSRLIWFRRLIQRKIVTLELTPPAHLAPSPTSTQELFSVIHGLRLSRTWLQKILHHEVILSFEIVSTRKGGIRYLVQAGESNFENLQKILTAYLPQIKIKRVKDQLLSGERVLEFKQTNHYAFPLKSSDILEQHDPVAYLAGAMANLDDDEEIRLQLIASPVELSEARTLSRRILNNDDLLTRLNGVPQIPLITGAGQLLSGLLFAITDLLGDAYHGPTRSISAGVSHSSDREAFERRQISNRKKPARSLSSFEAELMQTLHQKLNQPLYQVSIRAALRTANKNESKDRAAAIVSAIQTYQVPGYQSLQPKLDLPIIRSARKLAFRFRLPAFISRHGITLSSSELASLYHFPASTSQPDNLSASLSRTLAAPISLKQGNELDVAIGQNVHHGISTPIGLTSAERERHLYIIGGTGNGKTTMLFYSILQDVRSGKGIAVLDPHGDLAERILRYIPEDRIKDVIYMNPDDLSYPVGVNMLELPEGLTGDDLLREMDLITEATISVLRKIFSEDDTGGHRIEYVLRNSIQTALTLENPTLFTIFELLNNAKFRRKVVKTLTDQNLKDFWNNELGKAGEFQRVKMAAGITAKIGRFLFSASARRVLEQPTSTINFEEVISSKKILICNFSKGLLGEDTSTLFGTTILAKLQTAALRRARIGEDNRVPFFLYVDEFQNFATTSFVQMLSEARKYKLFLTMAEQSTSQQEQQRLVDIILANVGTIVCFRTGSPSDERLVLPLFSPFIGQGEIANLPAYSFYVRIAAVNAQEPMSGVTLLVQDKGSEKIARCVVNSSRQLYARHVPNELTDNNEAIAMDNPQIQPRLQKSEPAIKDDEFHSITAVR